MGRIKTFIRKRSLGLAKGGIIGSYTDASCSASSREAAYRLHVVDRSVAGHSYVFNIGCLTFLEAAYLAKAWKRGVLVDPLKTVVESIIESTKDELIKRHVFMIDVSVQKNRLC